MNIRITILYCERTVQFQAVPQITLEDIIKNSIESGYAKIQMLANPGVYSPEKNSLYQGNELKKKLEQIFPIVNIQGPPIELLILRKEEFDQYEVAIKSQPELQADCFPPDSTHDLVPQKQPSVDDLAPISMSTQKLQQQPSVDNLGPEESQQIQQQTQFVSKQLNYKAPEAHKMKTWFYRQRQVKVYKKRNLKQKQMKIIPPMMLKKDYLIDSDFLIGIFRINFRSIVDLNLYFGQLLLVGQKSQKTLQQLSIPSGALITVKARWTGGNNQ